jgi:DNA-binding PadR family transcriptional regulator
MQVGGPESMISIRELAAAHSGSRCWSAAVRERGLRDGWLRVVSGHPGARASGGASAIPNTEVYQLTPAGIEECKAWWATSGESFGALMMEGQARAELEAEALIQSFERKLREESNLRRERAEALRRFRETDVGKMVGVLRASSRPLDIVEIRSALDWPSSRPSSAALRAGVDSGAIVRVAHGVYDLPERSIVVPPSMTARLIIEMGRKPGGLSILAMSRAVGVDRDRLRHGVFRSMRAAGLVKSLGQARWSLTPAGVEKLKRLEEEMARLNKARQQALKARYG